MGTRRATGCGIVLALVALTSCGGGEEESSDVSGCEPTETVQSSTGFAETRGEGAEAWALLFTAPPWEVGQDVKVAWKMTGSGDFKVRAIGPEGEVVEPTVGPTVNSGSNWERPGDEWGTFFTLPSEGCWKLEARRTDAVSTVDITVT